MGSKRKEFNRESVSRIIDEVSDQAGRADKDEVRRSYRRAAALLAFFDPNTLRPLGDSSQEGKAVEYLAEDVIPTTSLNAGKGWMLRPEVRKQTLRQLGGAADILRALDANSPQRSGLLQEIFEAYLRGQAPPLTQQSGEELAYSLQVVGWLDGIVPDLPDAEEIQHLLSYNRFLDQFRVMSRGFTDRAMELGRLADYVGVFRPGSISNFLRRAVRVFSPRPLMIVGQGGIGKSALVAKFLLDHVSPLGEVKFPFAYIDLVNNSVSVDEPTSIIYEVMRQLEIQYPRRPELKEFRQRVYSLASLARAHEGLHHDDADFGTRGRNRREMGTLVNEFALLIRDLSPDAEASNDQPFLLVLDSFEEAQYLSRGYVKEFCLFLEEIQHPCPQLRPVFISRARAEDLELNGEKAEVMALGGFDREAAVKYLLARGIGDNQLASEIANRLGGNPLSLRLAADLVAREGADGLREIQTKKLFFSLNESFVQAQLYQRVLAHIHDPEVRTLAPASLVLRRITPDIILRLLAGPCGLSVPDIDRAARLFEEFRREVALVVPEADGALRHRPDLRKMALSALIESQPQKVKAVNEAAVNYYRGQDSLLSRAEEIYHMLQLGADPRQLDSRWREGVGELLRPSLDELPPGAREYLAVRLGLEG